MNCKELTKNERKAYKIWESFITCILLCCCNLSSALNMHKPRLRINHLIILWFFFVFMNLLLYLLQLQIHSVCFHIQMYNYELKIIHFKTLGLGFDKKNNILYDKQLKINPLILFSSPFHLTYLVVELEVLFQFVCISYWVYRENWCS